MMQVRPLSFLRFAVKDTDDGDARRYFVSKQTQSGAPTIPAYSRHRYLTADHYFTINRLCKIPGEREQHWRVRDRGGLPWDNEQLYEAYQESGIAHVQFTRLGDAIAALEQLGQTVEASS